MSAAPPWLDALHDVPAGAWLAIAAVLLLQRVVRRLGMWAYAAFALPGTAAHELAHYLAALLLMARPRFPSLWPRRSETGWRLGSVAFHAPWWRAGPIALAPVLLLPAGLAWIATFMPASGGVVLALHAWIAGTLLGAAVPSRADLRIAAPTLALLGVSAAAVVAWRLYA